MIKEYFGVGSICKLADILAAHNPASIFLVTGRASYEACGAMKILNELLKGYAVTRWCDFTPNPKKEDGDRGVAQCKASKSDFIIALGGGSVIDMAKLINYEEKMPLVAIPTTAGTGSEVTHFAAFYVDKTKHSLASPDLLPSYAIVDPQFTFYLPKKITASTGMDALAQAIESYWSIYATDESKTYAKEAIILAVKNLECAANRSTSDSRVAMAKAAHLAGKAINITKTTAPHAISYPITAYFGVPHGHAVALTLSSILAYNSLVDENDVLDKRGILYVKNNLSEIVALLGANDIPDAKNILDGIMGKIGLAIRLSALGITEGSMIDVIVKNGFNPERVRNNPRILTEEGLRKILKNIF